MDEFREKLARAMVGHTMAEVTAVLVHALAAVLSVADPAMREHMIEEACVTLAREASKPPPLQ